jgi:hypothetical protein
MGRDLRHVLWFMAAVMPIAIVASLLTSGVTIRANHAAPAGVGYKVGSVRGIDARNDAALEVSPRSDRVFRGHGEATTIRDGPGA